MEGRGKKSSLATGAGEASTLCLRVSVQFRAQRRPASERLHLRIVGVRDVFFSAPDVGSETVYGSLEDDQDENSPASEMSSVCLPPESPADIM